MLTFEWWWACLLLPLPLLLLRKKPQAVSPSLVIEVPFLHEFKQKNLFKKSYWLSKVTLGLAWMLVVLSLSKPMWIGDLMTVPVSGRDIMLAVDLSGSMSINDFEYQGQLLNRLQAIKIVASEFIERRKNDKIGLILFGDQAYLQAPLTFDKQTVRRLLLESAVGLAGQRTAIGDAIGLSIKKLGQKNSSKLTNQANGLENSEATNGQNLESNVESQKQDKILILLTDGANTAGELSPLKAAEIAKSYHLKIYTIGIGAKDLNNPYGFAHAHPEAELDEKTLNEIAHITGGQYFRATDIKSLESIYHQIDQFEPTASNAKYYRPQKSLFYYPLALALCILLLYYISLLKRASYVE